jgi:hypothetical protein
VSSTEFQRSDGFVTFSLGLCLCMLFSSLVSTTPLVLSYLLYSKVLSCSLRVQSIEGLTKWHNPFPSRGQSSRLKSQRESSGRVRPTIVRIAMPTCQHTTYHPLQAWSDGQRHESRTELRHGTWLHWVTDGFAARSCLLVAPCL